MRSRFAPSPSGPLHLGHAYAAIFAHDLAVQQGGEFLLRIEDIDKARSKPDWEAQIYDDLTWLGLTWAPAVMRQSERQAAYDAALDRLWNMGLLYPCTCNRRDIAAAMNAPQEGGEWPVGPDGLIYPGTCRAAPTGPRPQNTTLRLNLKAALAKFDHPNPFGFMDSGADAVPQFYPLPPDDKLLQMIGDFVVARKDFNTSYHIAVCIDDDTQNITHVTRGADLFDATFIHVILQNLLGLATPHYCHHRLIRDDAGKRLAKRDDAKSIAKFRAEGCSPDDIREMLGLNRIG